MDYSNTTTYKSTVVRGNNSGYIMGASTSLWRSTTAINSILFFSNGGNFAAGSTFKLYGIQAGSN